jgi:hypothetical protein
MYWLLTICVKDHAGDVAAARVRRHAQCSTDQFGGHSFVRGKTHAAT